MTQIAVAHASSTAAPSAFFARWADMATWQQWNADTEWARLDGPFAEGATGVLKPKGGPQVKFHIASLTDREFVDVSTLFGARLTFDHQISSTADRTHVAVTVTLTGPMGWFWNLAIGKGIRSGLQQDLNQLVAVAEAAA